MLRKSTLFLITLFAITTLKAQWGFNDVAYTQPGIELYEHAHFGGAVKVIQDDWSITCPTEFWNDRISSIRVPRGYEAHVFFHGGFQGRSMVVTGDWSIRHAHETWNDQISSIRIVRQRPGHCGTDVGITVYEHSDFTGASMNVTGTWVTPAWNAFWNDRISAISVPPGYEAVIYEHGNGGASCVITGDWAVWDGEFWNDRISRIEVRRRMHRGGRI